MNVRGDFLGSPYGTNTLGEGGGGGGGAGGERGGGEV